MICRKIRIPSIVGFIIVGILFGPYGFHILESATTIQTLGKIGILYIMLQAGIEVDINDFRQQRTRAIVFGIYSFLFPFLQLALPCNCHMLLFRFSNQFF